jgi:5-methylcytosine-specific restriction endonuclease McrA
MNASQRDLVRERAHQGCEYCHLPDAADEWPFHVDHIVARVHGGNDELSNLCWSCTQCNLHKGSNIASVDPQTGQRVDLFNPRLHKWEEHFELSEDGRIIGVSLIGRATVRLLDMNGSPQLDLRRELLDQSGFDI